MAAFKETTRRPKIINIRNNIISIIASSLLKSHRFQRSNTCMVFLHGNDSNHCFFAARQTEKPSTSSESRSRKSLLEEKPKSYRNKGSSNIDFRAQRDYNKHSRWIFAKKGDAYLRSTGKHWNLHNKIRQWNWIIGRFTSFLSLLVNFNLISRSHMP